jgi:hypothetical protein
MSRTKRATKSAKPTPRQVRLRDNRVREVEREFRKLREEHRRMIAAIADIRGFTRETDYNLCERILELRDRVGMPNTEPPASSMIRMIEELQAQIRELRERADAAERQAASSARVIGELVGRANE